MRRWTSRWTSGVSGPSRWTWRRSTLDRVTTGPSGATSTAWWTRRTSGPADQHVLSLSLAGYGLRLDHSYVRQIYASASGSTIREIVQDVLERAGLDDVFTSHGVELDDTITRAVYPVQSS